MPVDLAFFSSWQYICNFGRKCCSHTKSFITSGISHRKQLEKKGKKWSTLPGHAYNPHSFLEAFWLLPLAASLLKLAASWRSLSVETLPELVVTCTPLSHAVVWQGKPSRLRGLCARALRSVSERWMIRGASVHAPSKQESSEMFWAEKLISGTFNWNNWSNYEIKSFNLMLTLNYLR